MEQIRQLPWLRIAAEGTAIVISILLAFSIEAWWQTRSETDQERELLQALLDDFKATKDEIQDWRQFHLAVEKSTKALLDATLSGDASLTQADLRKLLSDLTWFDSESHFATGALNSTVNGGDLPKIQNQTLRRAIADWPTRIANAETIQRQDYEFFTQVLTPFLRAHTHLPLLAAENTARPGDPNTVFPRVMALSADEFRLEKILDAEGFQNILMQKTWIQFDILRQIDEVEVFLDQTIAVLSEELQPR